MMSWFVQPGRFGFCGYAVFIIALAVGLVGCSSKTKMPSNLERGQVLAHRYIILDGHIDTPTRGLFTDEQIGVSASGEFDHPRAIVGGLDAPFMSIYVPARFQHTGGARAHADRLIDWVEGQVALHPDKFVVATTPDDVRAAFVAGQVALPMGIENGAALEGSLEALDHFYRRGIRYITLTHGEPNDICDSSYSIHRPWKGLSPFGVQVVARMNELGIMVDVSHISDQAFWQVLEVSTVPVIATHSSMRHFTPGWERNMSDEMVRALGESGGVIQINFGSWFLNEAALLANQAFRANLGAFMARTGHGYLDAETQAFIEAYFAENSYPYATLAEVLDHIDRAVEIAGIDHVGLGSDFDGLGDTLPSGLKDVSDYPNLVAGLLERGYEPVEIEKILGGNLLRVWSQAQAHASRK